MKKEIQREIAMLKEKHKSKEEIKIENIRHSNRISKIEESEVISELEREKREEIIKQKKNERRIERERFILNYNKLFYKKPIHTFLIDFQNAELGYRSHELILKPTVYHLSFVQSNYNFYSKYFGFSFGLYCKEKKLEDQDMYLKLRIFKDRYRIYPIALAVGIVQYSYNISNFSNVDKIKWGISPSLMINSSFPQLYTTASIFIDRRKLSLAFQYYPFFEYFKGKMYLLLQNDIIFKDEYRNRFGNYFILQPGLGFELISNSLSIMLSFEDNEFVVMTFDYKF